MLAFRAKARHEAAMLAQLQAPLLVIRPDLRTLSVRGPDRQSWLNGLVTADLAPLGKGQAVYGLALNKKGKILTDLVVVQRDNELLVAVDGALSEQIRQELDHFLIMEDAELSSLEPPGTWVLVYGAQIEAVVETASQLGSAVASMGPLAGQSGAALWLGTGEPEAWLDKLMALMPAGTELMTLEQFDRARIELGIARFGKDFDPSTYPQEAGLDERAISFTKGCYLGQEVVVKMRHRGHPSRQLVRLVLEPGGQVPGEQTPVLNQAGEPVGTVTSAALGPRSQVPMAYAVIRRSELGQGAELRVGEQKAMWMQAWGGSR